MTTENQELNPSVQAEITRDAKGRWPPGVSGNPSGENNKRHWQPIAIRIQILAEKYTTHEIVRLAGNPEQLSDLPYWDAMCIVQMARSLARSLTITDTGADQIHKERESLLNRIEGTPVATIKTVQGSDKPPIDPDTITSEQAEDIYMDAIK